MRWPTTLFLLLGAVIGVSAAVPTCTLYKLPDPSQGATCEIIIDWRSRNEKEALATCLEYFPTTFVKGEKVGDKTKCIVSAAYQCKGTSVDSEVILMFDKCYYFPKSTKHRTGYHYDKITEYDSKNPCKRNEGGKLSVFYSSTHAKFVGMKAHRLGIDKIWIGITADGRKIEKEKDGTRMMIHKELWKLVKGDFWDGENLVKMTTGPNGKLKFNTDATHYFMRTRTDYLNNRWQGSFERAKGSTTEAAFVCEFEAKMTAYQEWYCDKLPALGIAAVYDKDERETDARLKKPRCLYVSATSYTFSGNAKDMAEGCMEKPSDLHSAGMDDGTASPKAYKELNEKNKGPLRLAGYRVDWSAEDPENSETKPKCSGPVTRDTTKRRLLFQKWRYLDHHEKIQSAAASQIPWDPEYPKNECSSFTVDSRTLGLKDGKKIDIPPQARAPVVCSIRFFQECGNKKNPCGADLECTNTHTYNPDYKGFYKCDCPGANFQFDAEKKIPYKVSVDKKTCTWHDYKYCAWLYYGGTTIWHLHANTKRTDIFVDDGDAYNDKLEQIVVRKNCKVTVYSHGKKTSSPEYELMHDVLFGTHEVPNTKKGSLLGDWRAMGASSAKCECW